MPDKPIDIFLSYSKKDEDLIQQFRSHLYPLENQGIARTWSYRSIEAGTDWQAEIKSHLQSSEIILLFISADFLASDFCYDVEMQLAMERAMAGDARVIPIILRPSNWYDAPFAKLQTLPRDGKPVVQWNDVDAAFFDVAREIHKIVGDMTSQSQPSVDKNILLDIQVSHDSPTDVVALEIANLCRAVNAYHIACGGSGLVINDWENFVEIEQLIGV